MRSDDITVGSMWTWTGSNSRSDELGTLIVVTDLTEEKSDIIKVFCLGSSSKNKKHCYYPAHWFRGDSYARENGLIELKLRRVS